MSGRARSVLPSIYLFLDQLRTPLLLEVLAGQPEEDVLLRVLAPQERPEDHAALCSKQRERDHNVVGLDVPPPLFAKFPIHC